nr:L-type lectin-domain containing receptor kinase VIII.2-like [Ipomoea batatas]
MASVSCPKPRYFLALFFLSLCFKFMSADPNLSFAFKNFGKDSNFDSLIALYGDIKVVNDSLSIEIDGSEMSPGAGRIMSKKPIKLVEGKPRKLVSFSTYFAFSLSRLSGDGLAFVMLPDGYPFNVFDGDGGSFGVLNGGNYKFLGVEFDILKDDKYGDVNGNHVGVDLSSLVSVKVGNVSSLNLELNSGEKLQSWIEYEASSKRLEVRLSKWGEIRPDYPLVSCFVDLSQMWKEDEVFVGLSTSRLWNQSHKCNVYSWSFKLRAVPDWMHSQPLDPKALRVGKPEEQLSVPKRSDDCGLKILGALIFGIGCGALGTLVVLFVWSVLRNRRPIVPEELTPEPKEYEYKKFQVVVDDKAIKDGKN